MMLLVVLFLIAVIRARFLQVFSMKKKYLGFC